MLRYDNFIIYTFTEDQLLSNALLFLQNIEAFISEYGTAMIWLIMALPMLAIFCIIVIPFLVRGFKQGSYGALVSLGSTIVSLIVSVLLAQGLGMILSKLLLNLALSSLSDYLSSLSESLAQVLEPGAYLTALVQWAISALLATVFFIILFIAALIICKVIIGKALSGLTKKEEKTTLMGFGGLGIRLVDALLIAFLFVAPFYSAIGFGSGLVENAVLAFENIPTEEEQNGSSFAEGELTFSSETAEKNNFTDTVLAISGPFADCPLVKIAKLPGLNFGERIFGAFICDGKLYNAYDIFNQGSDLIILSFDLVTGESKGIGEEEVEALKNMLASAEKNDFFYGVFGDIFHMAGSILDEQLKAEQEKGNDTTKAELIVAFCKPFTNCDAEDIKSCANALVGVLESAVNNNLFKEDGNTEDLLKSLAQSNFIDEAVMLLRSNSLLSDTVDNLLLLSLNFVNFSSESDDNARFEETIAHLKENVEENINSGSLDTNAEIRAFKTIFNGFFELYQSTDGLKVFAFDTISSKGIADLLTGLGSHPHIGANGAEDLINAALPSFGASATILTDDFIKSATGALVSDINNPPAKGTQGKFENLIFTAQNLTNAITNGFGAGKDKETLNNTIDVLLSDMTPESAEILTSVLTKDVMDSINKNGSSSGQTEVFVKDLLSNMASYDAPTKTELEKEREAIIKMNDLVLDADNKLNNKPEGQTSIEAAVGGDLKSFINDVSSSTVLMGTVNDSFEKNPDKTQDPTGMFASMGQQDKEKLNEVCGELLLDDSISASQKDSIKKLCHFMGGFIN